MSPEESIFANDTCLCGHSISEEHENGKCYALDVIGGNCYKACLCKNIKIASYSIGVDVNETSPSEGSIVIVNRETGEAEGFDKPKWKWGSTNKAA